ncbi:hypothetical protein BC831DRAFT_548787 [Entophlyctis helioformis]|nr:hypothetical protein BC831DRAFT_548787 [Entophlyctis helioformis]
MAGSTDGAGTSGGRLLASFGLGPASASASASAQSTVATHPPHGSTDTDVGRRVQHSHSASVHGQLHDQHPFFPPLSQSLGSAASMQTLSSLSSLSCGPSSSAASVRSTASGPAHSQQQLPQQQQQQQQHTSKLPLPSKPPGHQPLAASNPLGSASHDDDLANKTAALETLVDAYNRIQLMQDRALSGIDRTASIDESSACLLTLWRTKVVQLLFQRNWAEATHARTVASMEQKMDLIGRMHQESSHALSQVACQLEQMQQLRDMDLARISDLETQLQESMQAQADAVERAERAERDALIARDALSRMANTLSTRMDAQRQAIGSRLDLLTDRLDYASERIDMARVVGESSRRQQDTQAQQLHILTSETRQLRSDRRVLLDRLAKAELPRPTRDAATTTGPILQGVTDPQASHPAIQLPQPSSSLSSSSSSSSSSSLPNGQRQVQVQVQVHEQQRVQVDADTADTGSAAVAADAASTAHPVALLDQLQRLERLSVSLLRLNAPE